MKPLAIILTSLLISIACKAEESSQKWNPPNIENGVADLTKYDHEEFVAIRFLHKIQSGATPTKTKYQPVITDKGIEVAKTYLLKKHFEYHRDDEFQQRKSADQLNEMIKNESEPFRAVAGATHIKVDMIDHLIDTYDFDKSAFPFRPGSRGFSAHVSLYEKGNPLHFEPIPLDHLAIEPELAEKWKTNRGTLSAVCRIGTGFAPRNGFPALRVICEKFEFRSREGELIKEVIVPVSQRDINKDFTVEEMTNIDALMADMEVTKNPSEKTQKPEIKKSNKLTIILLVLLALAGAVFGFLKFKASRNAQK
jgi:hypothetical protein